MKWNGQSFIIITTKGIAVKALCCVLVMICQCQRKSDQTTIFHYVWFNCRIISLYNFSFIQFAGTHQILMKTILLIWPLFCTSYTQWWFKGRREIEANISRFNLTLLRMRQMSQHSFFSVVCRILCVLTTQQYPFLYSLKWLSFCLPSILIYKFIFCSTSCWELSPLHIISSGSLMQRMFKPTFWVYVCCSQTN